MVLLHHFNCSLLQEGVIFFLLKNEFFKARVALSEIDKAEVVLAVESLEVLHDITVGQNLVTSTAVLSVNDEHDTLSQNVVVAEHIVDNFLFAPLERHVRV